VGEDIGTQLRLVQTTQAPEAGEVRRAAEFTVSSSDTKEFADSGERYCFFFSKIFEIAILQKNSDQVFF
jgi:hypothetical protein